MVKAPAKIGEIGKIRIISRKLRLKVSVGTGLLWMLPLLGCTPSSGTASGSGGNRVAASGGAPGGAGSTASGSGGSLGSGGLGSGGSATDSGGAPGTGGGGLPASGGSGNTAGAAATGGNAATGGISATGGASGNGGVAATGGTTSTGGTAGTSTGPVLVSTIDLKGASGCPGMRLGDINGDGRMEIVVGQPLDQTTLDAYTPQLVVAITAFDLKGNQLWQYGKPNAFHTASSDIPIQVYDMDGDGKAEIFANFSRTEMTVLDGTGKLLRKIPLPAAGSNDSIAITNLRGTAWPQDIIVKTRYSQFWAITGVDSTLGPAGTVLWTHQKGPATGFSDLSTGHFPLAYDWNGDGKDEVMGGYDFMDSTGKTLWSSTTLKLHADAIATGDMDGNPANGKEIIVCGDVAAAYDWKTGTRLWQDTRSTEIQQLGLGDYRPDLPGLEVVLLDRLRTSALGLKSNNMLLDQHNNLLWREDRPNNSGWLTVTENLNNWDGKGSDNIFSYRRGSGGAFLYDGYQKTVATFPYPGTGAQNFTQHADICGDSREEVILYDETTAWIYSNGGCDLNAAPSKPSLPQQFHLYNWSIYTGWITPDVKFFTPGSKQ